MVVEWLTATQLGKAVGTSSSTAKKDIKKFSDFFESQKTDGVYRYADKSLEVLKRIEELKNEGRSRDDIRSILEKEYEIVKPAYEDKNGNGSYISKDVTIETQPRDRMLDEKKDDKKTKRNKVIDSETSGADEASQKLTSGYEAEQYRETAEKILTRDIVPMLREVLKDLAPDAREFVKSSVTVALSEAVRTVADQTSEILSLRNELEVIKDEMRHFITGNRLHLKDIENIAEFNTNNRIIPTTDSDSMAPPDHDQGTYDMFPEFDVDLMMKSKAKTENFAETVQKIRDGILEYGRYMKQAEIMEQKSQYRTETETGVAVEDKESTVAEPPVSEEITNASPAAENETADMTESTLNASGGWQDFTAEGGEQADVMAEYSKPSITGYTQNLPYYETVNYKAAVTDRVRDLKNKRGMSFSGIANKFSADGLRNFEGDDHWTTRQVKAAYYQNMITANFQDAVEHQPVKAN